LGTPIWSLLSTASAANIPPLLDRKIEETTANIPLSITRLLLSIGEDNIATTVKYISAIKSEVNLSDSYRKDLIALLSRFSKYNDNCGHSLLLSERLAIWIRTCISFLYRSILYHIFVYEMEIISRRVYTSLPDIIAEKIEEFYFGIC
jgi:hypothetical protein